MKIYNESFLDGFAPFLGKVSTLSYLKTPCKKVPTGGESIDSLTDCPKKREVGGRQVRVPFCLLALLVLHPLGRSEVADCVLALHFVPWGCQLRLGLPLTPKPNFRHPLPTPPPHY